MAPDPIVAVYLEDIHGHESHPNRYFVLKAPGYSCNIGRGSRSGVQNLFPEEHNALFESRVMSRDHALLTADPDTKTLYVEDHGSMHGTKLNDAPLVGTNRERVRNNNELTFGTDVNREGDMFYALRVRVSFCWVDDESGIAALTDPQSQRQALQGLFPRRRGFSVPDYDSDDEIPDDYDSDIECLGESVPRSPSVEIVPCPHQFRSFPVPESIVSSEDSVDYDEVDHETNTSPSSPTGLTDAEKQADLDNLREAQEANRQEALRAFEQVEIEDEYLTESDMDPAHSDDDSDISIHRDRADEPQSSQRQVSPVEVKVAIAPRAPSPSDAAMVKPPTAAEKELGSQYHPQCVLQSSTVSSSCANDSTRLPGINSIAVDAMPLPDPLRPLYQSTYSFGYPYDVEYYQPFEVVPGSNHPTNSESYRSPELDTSNLDIASYSCLSPRPSGVPLQSTLSGPKVLLQPKDTASSLLGQPRKRKAVEMASADPDMDKIGETTTADQQSQIHQLPRTTEEGAMMSDLVVPLSKETTNVPEPAPKRAKMMAEVRAARPRPRNGNFMRYAATAVAGMAVGAIGTVWGLVALPEDFFA